ncbi:MAG: hypothetical protein JO097_16095 [Acidobacteriaceae bacterium]|nr:hypothetical protein [Acidobacteriaceae bacterium]MBV9766034.1 hypothetical protein [Acidobacteriaceae bacterium]
MIEPRFKGDNGPHILVAPPPPPPASEPQSTPADPKLPQPPDTESGAPAMQAQAAGN